MRESDSTGRSRELVVALPRGQRLWRVYLKGMPDTVFEWHLTDESTDFILPLNTKDLRILEALFNSERVSFEECERRLAKSKGGS